jgi:anti-sigma B factor antagonist
VEVKVVQNKFRVVQADGEIDLSNSDKLDAALQEAVRDCPKGFIIDLSDADYLDSAGIQVILTAYRRILDAGGRVAIVIKHPNVIDIFEVINADRFPSFFVRHSVEEAEEALSEM